MTEEPGPALVVCSGGLDSVTLAHRLAAEPGGVAALVTFDYGQRHRKEIDFAARCAKRLGVRHEVVDLADVGRRIAGSALTDDAEVPEGHYSAETMAVTVVPNRNPLMLSAAFALAGGWGLGRVAAAMHTDSLANPGLGIALDGIAAGVDPQAQQRLEAPAGLQAVGDIGIERAIAAVAEDQPVVGIPQDETLIDALDGVAHERGKARDFGLGRLPVGDVEDHAAEACRVAARTGRRGWVPVGPEYIGAQGAQGKLQLCDSGGRARIDLGPGQPAAEQRLRGRIGVALGLACQVGEQADRRRLGRREAQKADPARFHDAAQGLGRARDQRLTLAGQQHLIVGEEASARLHDMLFQLVDRHETAMVVVTHNQTLASRADRILELDDTERRFVVCTGGGPGVMEAANRGASEAKGMNVGLSITLPLEQHENPYVTRELGFEFHYFFMRKFWFTYLAKAVIFFPGGFGTLDELFEILTLLQTRKVTKHMPIVLFGSDFWRETINFDALVKYGTINEEDKNLFTITDDLDEAYEIVTRELSRYGLKEPGAHL